MIYSRRSFETQSGYHKLIFWFTQFYWHVVFKKKKLSQEKQNGNCFAVELYYVQRFFFISSKPYIKSLFQSALATNDRRAKRRKNKTNSYVDTLLTLKSIEVSIQNVPQEL